MRGREGEVSTGDLKKNKRKRKLTKHMKMREEKMRRVSDGGGRGNRVEGRQNKQNRQRIKKNEKS